MPRTKKPQGQAVDRRNGRQATLESANPLVRFALPKRSDGEPYDLRTRRMYAAFWEDPITSVLSVTDREVVIRWAQAVDDWLKALVRAHASPIATGSMGQEVPSPWFAIAKQALDVADRCEAQIGVGALNRARLGFSIGQAQKSLMDLNRELAEAVANEQDPRLG